MTPLCGDGPMARRTCMSARMLLTGGILLQRRHLIRDKRLYIPDILTGVTGPAVVSGCLCCSSVSVPIRVARLP